MIFKTEAEFEKAVINALISKGWEEEVLYQVTEEDLLRNWANILFENNRGINQLNDEPLTDSEMQQIMERVRNERTPLKLNEFINGGHIPIKRDNPSDPTRVGKEVYLKIYDRQEIAAGQSRYQIVQQPRFKSQSHLQYDRRGDLLLLINGMPVFCIELKRRGIPVSQAYNQIEKYSDEGVFTGLFSLVQIFVAMVPDETVYFANPGPDGRFNKDFYFHWADFNNEPINKWNEVVAHLLSIPMAHQLIGFYTVADDSDGILKVLRSYQYYAANAISSKVSKINWQDKNNLGGYIWHTTGSGKTMTSFKSAQLIANSKDADKVIFLMDRIELGTQSLREYRSFAEDSETVQATEDTRALINKLKSNNPSDTLIVTSIQKMSNIKDEENGLMAADIAMMNSKRIVIIVDEAHRSTFGDMLITIKQTFPDAIFFGFTGTPIHKENQKSKNTTATVFGDELHRYSIADGIRDGNVLGFDLYKVTTFKDIDLRRAVALKMANADNESEAIADAKKSEVFYHYMNKAKVKMAGYTDTAGKRVRGIEDEVPRAQYQTAEHRQMVVSDIMENWVHLSRGSQFHAIFATSSIYEAIEYYRMFKESNSGLRVAALFDPNIDNNGGVRFKEEGLIELLVDYNKRYEQDFTLPTFAAYKKDVAARLAHKSPYSRILREPEKQVDLLIVVDQMLTGFDSKWVNTLYLDKVLRYESIIQAFSRTNRLFGPEKPFGTIRYYRYPNTMEKNIEAAVELYSGNRPLALFAEQLDYNLGKMNSIFQDIERLFTLANVHEFSKLPDDPDDKQQFAKLFGQLNEYLEAAKIQGFVWTKSVYEFKNPVRTIEVLLDENTYLVLALRYKELAGEIDISRGVPFDISGYLMSIDTGMIDTSYMNSRFQKYLKILRDESVDPELLRLTLDELHKSFSSLTQEEQKYANIFLYDVQSGNVEIEDGKPFRDYVNEYLHRAKNEQVRKLNNAIGVDIGKLEELMYVDPTEANINEYGRFDALKKTVIREKAEEYFVNADGTKVPPFRLGMKIDNLLKEFVLKGGFDLDDEE